MSNEPKTTEQPKTEPKKEKKPNPVIVGHLWEPINPKPSPDPQEDTAPDPRVEALTQEIASLKRQLLALVTGSEGWGKTDRIKALEEKIAKLEAQAPKPKHVSVWDTGPSNPMGMASKRGRK